MNRMFRIVLAVLTAGLATSCGLKKDEPEKVPVPPKSENSQLPWNLPKAGQGGGMMGVLPKTPRR